MRRNEPGNASKDRFAGVVPKPFTGPERLNLGPGEVDGVIPPIVAVPPRKALSHIADGVDMNIVQHHRHTVLGEHDILLKKSPLPLHAHRPSPAAYARADNRTLRDGR